MGDLDPHLIHGSPGPPKSSTQTAVRSVQPFFAGLTSVTDRPTDHATQLVRIGRIYIRSTAVRPDNNQSASDKWLTLRQFDTCRLRSQS